MSITLHPIRKPQDEEADKKAFGRQEKAELKPKTLKTAKLKNEERKESDGLCDAFGVLFISPEIQRRQTTGTLPKNFELRAAQIIFYSDGRKPEVRINSEVKGVGFVKLKAGVSKKPSEQVYEHEVDGLNKINLLETDDPDCAHATLIKIGNNWVVAVDFRYNKAFSKKHVQVAQEFLNAAEFSFNKKNWHCFVDTLFSASELLVKAKLLLLPDPNFKKKTTHKGIMFRCSTFAKICNITKGDKLTFTKLSGLRDKLRYVKETPRITEDEARILLEGVRNMIEAVKTQISV